MRCASSCSRFVPRVADYVLILAGDHLYRMDYSEMARFHWDHDADITVAVQPVRTR